MTKLYPFPLQRLQRQHILIFNKVKLICLIKTFPVNFKTAMYLQVSDGNFGNCAEILEIAHQASWMF